MTSVLSYLQYCSIIGLLLHSSESSLHVALLGVAEVCTLLVLSSLQVNGQKDKAAIGWPKAITRLFWVFEHPRNFREKFDTHKRPIISH